MGEQSRSSEDAVDCKSLALVKETFKKFVDGFHEKASTLTSWMSSLEPPTLPNPNPRQVALLGVRALVLASASEVCRGVPEYHEGGGDLLRDFG